jgi:hypothetical protein
VESENVPRRTVLTLGETAALLAVDERTVRKWHKRGLLQSLPGGGKGIPLFFEAAMVEEFERPRRGRPKSITAGRSRNDVIAAIAATLSDLPDQDRHKLVDRCRPLFDLANDAGVTDLAQRVTLTSVHASECAAMIEIRARRSLGATYAEVSIQIGVSSKTVSKLESIWQRRAWGELDSSESFGAAVLAQVPYRGRSRKGSPLSPQAVLAQSDEQESMAARDEDDGGTDDEYDEDYLGEDDPELDAADAVLDEYDALRRRTTDATFGTTAERSTQPRGSRQPPGAPGPDARRSGRAATPPTPLTPPRPELRPGRGRGAYPGLHRGAPPPKNARRPPG